MKLGLKQTLGHLVSILNGEAKRKKLLKLEDEIEQMNIEANLHKLNDVMYKKKIDRLNFLQYEYLITKGHYYHIGMYEKKKPTIDKHYGES
jgi:hypothetical protein